MGVDVNVDVNVDTVQNATWVLTSEVYSTDLRTEGHALGSACSKITAFLSPFLVFSDAGTLATGAAIGAMNAIAAAATLCLPEDGRCS